MNNDIYAVIEHLNNQVTDISYVILAAGRQLAKTTGGEVVGLLLGNGAQDFASNMGADRILYVDDKELSNFTSDAYQKVVGKIIQENEPRAVLFGNTSIGSDIASVLSARLDLPIINSCQKIGEAGLIISNICGGKIMTETPLPSKTTLITINPGGYKPEQGMGTTPPSIVQINAPDLTGLRTIHKGYIQPEAGDVDISKESVLISVGRGIQNQDNIELAEELAAALGGTVCASRPVVDQGWLPASRMVGKSGKSVKPKLYLAIGISGAPEHVESITDSDTIIAINMDPKAPIFNIAKYGIAADLFDLIEVLTEKVSEAKLHQPIP